MNASQTESSFVQALNEHQCGVGDGVPGHPFTCGRRDQPEHGHEGGDTGILVATSQGWQCPYCEYEQAYAWFEPLIVQAVNDAPADSSVFAAFAKQLKGDERARVDKHIAQYESFVRRIEAERPGSAQAARAARVAGVMVRCLRTRAAFEDRGCGFR